MKSGFKKISIIMIIIYMMFSNLFVIATTETNLRTEDNLRVSDDIEVTSSNIDNISDTPSVKATEKIYDYAELLTPAEEENLYIEIEKFIDKYKMDMIIVTINENPKSSAMVYADDFYDYNDFGIGDSKDGLLFLMDMDTRVMWISTTGKAIKVFTDAKIDSILDYTYPEIKAEDYYGCASEFITQASKKAQSSLGLGAVALKVCVVPAIITLIYILVGVSKHRTVHRKFSADTYINKKNGNGRGVTLTNKEDRFITSHTSRVRRESSSGGGSSTHSGSSGSSHGGGGRSF